MRRMISRRALSSVLFTNLPYRGSSRIWGHTTVFMRECGAISIGNLSTSAVACIPGARTRR